MDEDWREIPDFSGYSVSDRGRVRQDAFDRLLTPHTNSHKTVMVGLMRGGVQHKRALAPLVARAFLPPGSASFNTPVNLNGDRTDCSVGNLMWRPLWFAYKFHRQFNHPLLAGFKSPLRDTATDIVYDNGLAACTAHGLLSLDIVDAVYNHTYVWPTYQVFRLV